MIARLEISLESFVGGEEVELELVAAGWSIGGVWGIRTNQFLRPGLQGTVSR